MPSMKAFILGLGGFLIGTGLAKVAGSIASTTIWGSAALLALSAVCGIYGLVMFCYALRLYMALNWTKA